MKAQDMSQEQLARYIDYSVLKPEYTLDEIYDLCKKANYIKINRIYEKV